MERIGFTRLQFVKCDHIDVQMAQEELSRPVELCMQKLKSAMLKSVVYEADDVFDEVNTVIKRKQQSEEDATISNMFQQFFSHKNPISFADDKHLNINELLQSDLCEAYDLFDVIKREQQSEEDATIFTKDQQFFSYQNHIGFASKISRKVGTIWRKTKRINTLLNTSAIVEEDRREGAYLKSKEHLNEIKIMFYERERDGQAKRLMEELRPHSNLKGLELRGRNLSMPSWATGNRLVKFLPNLIRLQLSNLDINNLTCLGNLPHLKTLTLEYLNELEYMIDYCVASATTCLYPSLEKLVLYYLPKLKGWRRSSTVMAEEVYYEQLLGEISDNIEPLRLPQLSELWVKSCPKLEGILLCYVVEDLNLQEFNPKLLQVITQEPGGEYHHHQPNIPLENRIQAVAKL